MDLGAAPLSRLPDFPWDTIAAEAALARSHPDGIVDLSVGTPVDPVPAGVQQALAGATNWPGYPTTQGTQALREAAAGWLVRSAASIHLDSDAVLPVAGTKELVAWLPTLIGVGDGALVAVPSLAYPTYRVGAELSRARVVVADHADDIPAETALVWINSPSNPTGAVLSVDQMAALVARAREVGALVASDECYLSLGWDAEPVSVLDARVNGGSLDGVLAVHSLSKRSNLAGYRCGFVAGDPAVIAVLLGVRKHAGMIVAGPIQDAAVSALDDDAHAVEQKQRYRARRELLSQALQSAGFTIEHSQAGLYLWATAGEPAITSVRRLAALGILVAPGTFYGAAGERHVRVALTATDERVAAAVQRLSA